MGGGGGAGIEGEGEWGEARGKGEGGGEEQVMREREWGQQVRRRGGEKVVGKQKLDFVG